MQCMNRRSHSLPPPHSRSPPLHCSPAACGVRRPPRQRAPAPPPTVAVVSVTPETVRVSTQWIATLDGLVNAQIRPQVSGYLVRTAYRDGAAIKKGDVLFEIDPRPFEAALALAEAQLAQARAQLGRTEQDVQRDKPLALERAIAQSQLDNDVQANLAAQASVKVAEAMVETARLNLGFTKVRSLVGGIAAIASAQLGDLVGPTTLLTTVSQVDPIRAYFSLNEQEYLAGLLADQRAHADQVALGQRHRAHADARGRPGVSRERHVPGGRPSDRSEDRHDSHQRDVSQSEQPASARPVRPRQRRHSGREETSCWCRSGRSPTSRARRRYASSAPDDTVQIKTITLGERIGSRWIVEKGIEAGDRVIVDSGQLAPGTKVGTKPFVDRHRPRARGRATDMAAFFIRRPIVAIVIAIVTVLGGIVSLRGLPVAQFPNIVPPQIMVTANYTGADAVTIEQSVATPLEQAVNGVDDMIYMQSTNGNDGSMQLTVTFGIDTNPNIDQVNVQNRMAQAQPNLPPDVAQYGLTMRKTTGPADDARRPLLAEEVVRRALPRQLRQHQHRRRAVPRRRRRRSPHLRHRRLRDADLGEARSAGVDGHHRPRGRAGGAAAEHGQSRRPARWPARSVGTGHDLHRARRRPAADAGAVRRHRRALEQGRLGRAPSGRGADRAGLAELSAGRPRQRAARRRHRGVPGARLECAGRGAGRAQPVEPAAVPLPGGRRLHLHARHHRCRSRRESGRS